MLHYQDFSSCCMKKRHIYMQNNNSYYQHMKETDESNACSMKYCNNIVLLVTASYIRNTCGKNERWFLSSSTSALLSWKSNDIFMFRLGRKLNKCNKHIQMFSPLTLSIRNISEISFYSALPALQHWCRFLNHSNSNCWLLFTFLIR